MAGRTFPFREYIEIAPPVPLVRYKGMELAEFILIDEQWVLLILKVPQPYGGTYEECVSQDTIVEEMPK